MHYRDVIVECCKSSGAEYVSINTFVDSHWMFPRCISEKHRRGRKPGSNFKVSYPFIRGSIIHLWQASKILRCLEKGLNAAKLKQVKASTFPYTLLLTRVRLKAMLHSVPCFNLSTNTAHQVCSSLLLLTVIANAAFHPGSRFSDGDDDEDSDQSYESFPPRWSASK